MIQEKVRSVVKHDLASVGKQGTHDWDNEWGLDSVTCSEALQAGGSVLAKCVSLPRGRKADTHGSVRLLQDGALSSSALARAAVWMRRLGSM